MSNARHIKNIRKKSVAQGFSQEFVAKKLGVSQQTYSQLERNPEDASLGKLKALAKILNVEFLTLIDEDETYIQTNLNQKGGNAAAKMIINTSQDDFIDHLKNEIQYLKNEVSLLLDKVRTVD